MKFTGIQSGTVTLNGDVTQPYMKDDMTHAVKRIDGVAKVDNHVNVLRLSPYDARSWLVF